MAAPPRLPSVARWIDDPQLVDACAVGTLGDDGTAFRGTGMQNLANNCFANAVVQVRQRMRAGDATIAKLTRPNKVLLATGPLRAWMSRHPHAHARCVRRARYLYCACCDLERVAQTMSTINPRTHVGHLNDMLRHLPTMGLRPGMQEDAAVFLTSWAMEMQRAVFESLDWTPTLDEENTTALHQLFGGYVEYSNQCMVRWGRVGPQTSDCPISPELQPRHAPARVPFHADAGHSRRHSRAGCCGRVCHRGSVRLALPRLQRAQRVAPR